MTDTTKTALESLGMDLQPTLARFVGNESLLFRFLNRLPSEPTYGQLVAAMEKGDTEDAFHQAHTLKGVVGNLGLGNLFDAVSPVVELLRAGDLAAARAAFPPVQVAYDEAIRTITSLSQA